jgi:hypothetical protein
VSARAVLLATLAGVAATLAAMRNGGAASRRVPVDVATIQGAIDASAAGDTVAIDPGSYAERLALKSGVIVRAASAPGSVTVDAQGLGACVASSFVAAGTRLEGLRLVGGTGQDDGGGTIGGALRVLGGSLEVSDCSFEGSNAHFGGGSGVQTANVTFTRCRWSGTSASFGGGHFQAGGFVRIFDAVFDDVTADAGGAGYATLGAQLTVQGARITRALAHGDGGGFHLDSGATTLSDVWLDGARATGRGGGLAVLAGGQVLASFCVFVDNESGLGGGAFHVSCAPSVVASAQTDCAMLDLTHVDVVGSRGAAPAAGGVDDAAALRMRSSVVAGNASGLACLDSRATLDVACTALYLNGGPDLAGTCSPAVDPANLAVDPHLCDLSGRDFHLCANSPLLDPGCGEAFWGAFGEGCAGCGPTPAATTSWGRLKAEYHR